MHNIITAVTRYMTGITSPEEFLEEVEAAWEGWRAKHVTIHPKPVYC